MDSKADKIFRSVPKGALPIGAVAALVEVDGQPRFLIREDAPLPDVLDDLNQIATHLIRHGLWEARRDSAISPPTRRVRPAS